jgi:hypothetical protein
MTRFLLQSDTCGFVDMRRPLWREDGFVFYNWCCLRHRSHSQVRVPRGSWPYFTVSDLRLPKPGGSGPCIYISQEQGGPVITPGTGFQPRGDPAYYITTDGQSASLSWNKAPIWSLRPDFLLMPDNCWPVDVGRHLWREVESVFYYVQCTIYLHFTCYLALFIH